jgi:hypothetical protein
VICFAIAISESHTQPHPSPAPEIAHIAPAIPAVPVVQPTAGEQWGIGLFYASFIIVPLACSSAWNRYKNSKKLRQK